MSGSNKKKTASAGNADTPYILQLFISDTSETSVQAEKAVREISEVFLKGKYKIEIVDVQKNPEIALENQILITPTLIEIDPPPPIRIVGSMVDLDKTLSALRIEKGNLEGNKG